MSQRSNFSESQRSNFSESSLSNYDWWTISKKLDNATWFNFRKTCRLFRDVPTKKDFSDRIKSIQNEDDKISMILNGSNITRGIEYDRCCYSANELKHSWHLDKWGNILNGEEIFKYYGSKQYGISYLDHIVLDNNNKNIDICEKSDMISAIFIPDFDNSIARNPYLEDNCKKRIATFKKNGKPITIKGQKFYRWDIFNWGFPSVGHNLAINTGSLKNTVIYVEKVLLERDIRRHLISIGNEMYIYNKNCDKNYDPKRNKYINNLQSEVCCLRMMSGCVGVWVFLKIIPI